MRILSIYVLLSVLVGLMITDAMLASHAQHQVLNSCRTQVAYDKSGDLYCRENLSVSSRN